MTTTTEPRLLQIGRQMPQLEAALAARYAVHRLADEADPAAFLKTQGHHFNALVTSAAIGVDNSVIEALPQLKVISSFGVGLDKIDVAFAGARGVQVGYTPEVLTDCVADLAFGLLIDAARQIAAGDRFVRRGAWESGKYPMTTRVSGKKLGIFGMGRIGSTIARRSSGFDMSVRYTNRHPVAGSPLQFGAVARQPPVGAPTPTGSAMRSAKEITDPDGKPSAPPRAWPAMPSTEGAGPCLDVHDAGAASN